MEPSLTSRVDRLERALIDFGLQTQANEVQLAMWLAERAESGRGFPLTRQERTNDMIPHSCPVCSGRGSVPLGFYSGWFPPDGSSSTVPPIEMCRSCAGSGVLWR